MKTMLLIPALLALALGGCTSALSPDRAASVNLQKNGFALATWEQDASPAKVVGIRVEAPLRPVDRPERPLLDPWISSKRRLWLVALPAGRYQVSEWYMAGALDNAAAPSQRFEFEVRPGEVTYLGNFDLAVEMRGKPGHRRATRAWMLLDDQYGKAAGEFEKQYPVLAAMPVRDAAPQRFVWDQWPRASYHAWSPGPSVYDYNPWGIALPAVNPLWP